MGSIFRKCQISRNWTAVKSSLLLGQSPIQLNTFLFPFTVIQDSVGKYPILACIIDDFAHYFKMFRITRQNKLDYSWICKTIWPTFTSMSGIRVKFQKTILLISTLLVWNVWHCSVSDSVIWEQLYFDLYKYVCELYTVSDFSTHLSSLIIRCLHRCC